MLLELNIRNIALIERLHLELGDGLNVLTGETGAGKSIVIDSVNLVLGGRADRELIRSGADKASVQAVFDVAENDRVKSLLDSWQLEAEDGILTLGRELSCAGRNICRVAGNVVPLSQLRQIAALLVEMHGQHEHQSLMSPANHLGILDRFGGEDHFHLAEQVKAQFEEYSALRRRLTQLRLDLRDRALKQEVLSRQKEEIEALHLKKGEDEKLERQFTLMQNAEKLSSSVEKAYHLVYTGTERSPSAAEALRRASAAMDKISGIDARFDTLSARLNELYIGAQDAGYELQDLMEGLDFDPAAFDRIGSRLEEIERVKRKYGPELEDVLRQKDEIDKQLKALDEGDLRADELKEQIAFCEGQLRLSAQALSLAREQLARRFEQAVTEQLAQLGMSRVRFEVRMTRLEQPGAQGFDAVEFFISPNPGEPLKPLSGTASGGELSRIMLAVKTIMADRDQVGTMIFDEIDTGVSGHMAQVVGEKMSTIGRRRQVLAVSHLPQIAALGDHHFLVEKTVSGDRTGSSVRALTDEERVDEIARMVGGAGDPETGRTHAKSMLAAARALRSEAPQPTL